MLAECVAILRVALVNRIGAGFDMIKGEIFRFREGNFYLSPAARRAGALIRRNG
ncbi:hypothetical protein N826_03150 [Skermanella aerolata KACC 11604]|nr:hypothetical protein N826_03150 [Skermanella aerolata KACC 11604]